ASAGSDRPDIADTARRFRRLWGGACGPQAPWLWVPSCRRRRRRSCCLLELFGLIGDGAALDPEAADMWIALKVGQFLERAKKQGGVKESLFGQGVQAV